MKKIFTTAVVALSVMAAVAQDVDRKEMKFDYIRMPMKPLVKGATRNAQGEIVPDYLKKIDEQSINIHKNVGPIFSERSKIK